MVYLPQLGSRPSTILFKYIGQWIKTARILQRERPDTVFVMTPPLFAALPAFWYAWRYRKNVVLDAHTAAFVLPRWRWFQWLQRRMYRHAVTTLVSNDHLAALVRDAGGDATVVPDVPVVFAAPEPLAPPAESTTVAVVCSFDQDEPIEIMVAAAALLPDVRFFVTGNPSKLAADVRERLSPNVTLTGFLSTAAYGGLLAGADMVMVLTTHDHTMQRGAWEAIYQGTPVIVSDWQILRDAFPEGAVHVDNTPGSIAAAVRAVQGDPAAYRAGAARLRHSKLERWRSTERAILSKLTPAGVASSNTAKLS